MGNAPKHRQAILEAAVRLFRQQGYAATGLSEILAASGAPKGSLYYYFPNGKAEIGLAAIELAAEKVAATLSALAANGARPEKIVARYLDMVGNWMRQSAYADGSPITTIVLEMASRDDKIREAAADAFRRWAAILEHAAVEHGCEPTQAAETARVTIALIEGALIQCRVRRSVDPLSEAAAQVKILFRETDLRRRCGHSC
ncbi:MAG: TetR/AcrR family transcriptional regulator [Hyphomonadaceae bacterium]|nr:TetR/AcrR family transcriptional regulator [Hyphomonadaceae bacterium]